MKKKVFQEYKKSVIDLVNAGASKSSQIKAILMLAEVVNEGVIALQGICEALSDPDSAEIIRRDKEASDAAQLQAEALGADADPNAPLTDDPEATLDERSPVNQARKP